MKYWNKIVSIFAPTKSIEQTKVDFELEKEKWRVIIANEGKTPEQFYEGFSKKPMLVKNVDINPESYCEVKHYDPCGREIKYEVTPLASIAKHYEPSGKEDQEVKINKLIDEAFKSAKNNMKATPEQLEEIFAATTKIDGTETGNCLYDHLKHQAVPCDECACGVEVKEVPVVVHEPRPNEPSVAKVEAEAKKQELLEKLDTQIKKISIFDRLRAAEPETRVPKTKLKITSDGTPSGTKLTYGDTEIDLVTSVTINIDANAPTVDATVTFFDVELDLIANVNSLNRTGYIPIKSPNKVAGSYS